MTTPATPYVLDVFTASARLDDAILTRHLASLVAPVVKRDEGFFFPTIDVTLRVVSQGEPRDPDELARALDQTWDWPDAEHALSHATGLVTLTAEGAGKLPREDLLKLVHGVLRATLEAVDAVAIHVAAAQRLVEPHFYRESVAHGAGLGDALVNARLFKISDGKPGEMIMDTLGLAPFGLPDLQIHFAGLNPGRIAPVLLTYAEYLFEKGDVLGDDALVRGIESHEEWPCARTKALIAPARDVVDIKPDRWAVAH